jgi:6-phospho-beta-glucosidase
MYHKQLKPFQDNFLWSASTSAYQVEGAWNEEGKGPSTQDVLTPPENTTDFKVTSDHYHHMEEDVKLFAEMGLKAYRFSIAWSRVIPEGRGEVNPKGIEFYSRLIDELLKYNIEPIITMFHFDLPLALAKEGGWSKRSIIKDFKNFSKVLFENYGDRVKYWLTINEQNMMILHGNILGTSTADGLQDVYQQNHHMLLAQAEAMILCHQMLPHAKIGPAPNISNVYPASSKPEDSLAAENWTAIRNWLYLDAAVRGIYNPTAWSYLEDRNALPKIEEGDMETLKAAKPDFIAFNYYNSTTVSAADPIAEVKTDKVDQQKVISEPGVYQGEDNPNLPETPFGWGIDPVGFRITLRQIYDRYQLPLIVTENGIGLYETLDENGEINDDVRIEFYQDHIKEIQEAITDGVEVFGYSPWSAIDLVSTHEGFRKRYGFIYVNREDFDLLDMKRIPKKSFYWYQELIKENKIPEQNTLVEK